jgi:hypothetical protein
MKNQLILSKLLNSLLEFFIGAFITMFLLFTVSCEDILEENPKTVAAEKFYKTAADFETATNAIYTPLRDPWNSYCYPYVLVLECHTEYAYGRGGSSAALDAFQGLDASNMNFVTGPWDLYYLSIRNANFVIKNALSENATNQIEIKQYLAEARFLRAFVYFMLVKNWGGVPLRTENNMEERDLPRSTADEVYNFIIADLLEAENNLPDVTNEIGRPTKYAAKTMLADVYLNRSMFAEARDKANEVISSNKYSLVPVTKIEDFMLNLFGPDLITTPEEIFSLKFSHILGQGSFFSWAVAHPSTLLNGAGGAYAYYAEATDLFYTTWDNNDLRKWLWDTIDFGRGPTTLVNKKFIDPACSSVDGAGNDFPIYRYSEVLLIYAEAAARASNSPTAEAMEALNQVHRRAYGKDPTTTSLVDFNLADYSLDTFLDLILKERGYEFQFEGKRWHDLKRTGKAQEIIFEYKGKNIAERHYLWPIPLSELNFNKAIDPAKDQNPGY